MIRTQMIHRIWNESKSYHSQGKVILVFCSTFEEARRVFEGLADYADSSFDPASIDLQMSTLTLFAKHDTHRSVIRVSILSDRQMHLGHGENNTIVWFDESCWNTKSRSRQSYIDEIINRLRLL